MRKNILWLFALLFPFMGLVSCSSDDDIVFDHEQPMFDIQADKILLEVILPSGTLEDDEVYISGAFNGGDEVAVGNPEWALLRTEKSKLKRGVYLDPAKFQGGATLADGYHFVSATQRNEVSARGDSIVRHEVYNIGTRTNIYVDQWAAFFDSGNEPVIEHDGFALFVDDQTGWPALGLYAWGDAEAFGGWPGKTAPTGTQIINGVRFKYFDLGEENTGLNLHLILNDVQTNNKQVDDVGGAGVVIDHDIYVRLTESGWELIDVTPTVKHDGFAVFVVNKTSWDEIRLYQWGDVDNLNGGWPGAEATGTQTINGIEFTYWDMGEANAGLNQKLIFNNNNQGTQLADFAYTIDHDVYLEVSDGGVKEIDPANYTDDGNTPAPVPVDEKVIIAVKNSVGYADPHLYVYGDGEACGGWPGAAPVKITDNGWYLFELPANGNYTLILNDNGSPQVDGPQVSTVGSHFFDVNATWVESPNTVTIQNNSYTDPRLYAWGNGEIYGSWRGIKPTSNENGTLVFPLPNDGGEYNLILNGEGDGVQQDIAKVIANQSSTFTAN